MTSPLTGYILWGASGHAKVLRECLSSTGSTLLCTFDNDFAVPPPFPDVVLHHGAVGLERWLMSLPSPGDVGYLVAIGGDKGRERLAIQDMLRQHGLRSMTAVHPTAFVTSDAVVGAGSQILAQTGVAVGSIIGCGCIINTGAIVDHECFIEDGVHLCPGARLAGCVSVGACATIGTGAIVLPRIRIGADAIVGAGAVVIDDVPEGAIVAGNPAKLLRTSRDDNHRRRGF